MNKEILFASSNKGKLEEFQYVADYYGFNIKIVSVYKKYPQIASYNEDYSTQEKIVENGAREIYSQVKEPLIVEDTILEVDTLKKRPGLRSNTYLKEYGREGLLKEMKGKKNRKARIISIVGFFDGKLFFSLKNIVEGNITEKESYKEGEPIWVGPTYTPFGGGYNSIFLSSEAGENIADLTAEEGLLYGYREPNFKAVLEYILSRKEKIQ